jgi:tRNA A37 threonylcarbamoyladenosine synthetase subunit TsaC/SUA5/YrdC
VADKHLADFLQQTGPLATTSANAPGQPAAENLQQALDYFKDSVDFYVDGGDLSAREASTVIGFDGEEIKIFREGAVKADQLERLKNANS